MTSDAAAAPSIKFPFRGLRPGNRFLCDASAADLTVSGLQPDETGDDAPQ
jgi:hypothetical protein